jgi:hypothetical protein
MRGTLSSPGCLLLLHIVTVISEVLRSQLVTGWWVYLILADFFYCILRIFFTFLLVGCGNEIYQTMRIEQYAHMQYGCTFYIFKSRKFSI